MGPKCMLKYPYKKEISHRRRRLLEQRCKMLCCFGDGRSGQGPRNTRSIALESGKGNQIDSPLEPLKGAWLCRHLCFSPVKPVGASGLQNCKKIQCVVLSYKVCSYLLVAKGN